ncbi:hypothetical protein PILCRDRAFT_176189 [Piloderma croceum F 1598]|uniref:Uncharacterized protein n=1 Tax=Piloderma croceum (strain F 1598) TaxID=765440 RepID=A0A0C3CKP7_PILCF|nr:hypothetical protein PILCRDRAFT_176189 [Piloderma croceum F 1598]
MTRFPDQHPISRRVLVHPNPACTRGSSCHMQNRPTCRRLCSDAPGTLEALSQYLAGILAARNIPWNLVNDDQYQFTGPPRTTYSTGTQTRAFHGLSFALTARYSIILIQ